MTRPPATDRDLFDALSAPLTGHAERVVLGLNWTLVEGPVGAGLAQTPSRGTAGCHGLPSPGDYGTQPLRDLAALHESDNVFERVIAVAAINAHWNRYDLDAPADNGLDLIDDRGIQTVVVGRFPGLAERLPGAAVVEREPGPDDYPEAAMDTLLPEAAFVAVTASALGNGSLPRILALSTDAFTLLLGPSTPLSPALFGLGVDALSGFVVSDVDGIVRVIGEGGAVRALRRFGRYATLRRPGS